VKTLAYDFPQSFSLASSGRKDLLQNFSQQRAQIYQFSGGRAGLISAEHLPLP